MQVRSSTNPLWFAKVRPRRNEDDEENRTKCIWCLLHRTIKIPFLYSFISVAFKKLGILPNEILNESVAGKHVLLEEFVLFIFSLYKSVSSACYSERERSRYETSTHVNCLWRNLRSSSNTQRNFVMLSIILKISHFAYRAFLLWQIWSNVPPWGWCMKTSKNVEDERIIAF